VLDPEGDTMLFKAIGFQRKIKDVGFQDGTQRSYIGLFYAVLYYLSRST